jgi:hypothetical protein
MLASQRIFGYSFSGNRSTGQKEIAKPDKEEKILNRYRITMPWPRFDFDWLHDEREKARH